MNDIKALLEKVKQHAEFDADVEALNYTLKIYGDNPARRKFGDIACSRMDFIAGSTWQHGQLQPLLQAQSEIIEGLVGVAEAMTSRYESEETKDLNASCLKKGMSTGTYSVLSKALTQATDKLKGLVGE